LGVRQRETIHAEARGAIRTQALDPVAGIRGFTRTHRDPQVPLRVPAQVLDRAVGWNRDQDAGGAPLRRAIRRNVLEARIRMAEGDVPAGDPRSTVPVWLDGPEREVLPRRALQRRRRRPLDLPVRVHRLDADALDRLARIEPGDDPPADVGI